MTRTQARETAFALFFERLFGTATPAALYGELFETAFTEEDYQYIENLLALRQEHLAEMDEQIAARCRGWALERIARVDRALLQLALCELLYCPNIPPKAAMNEAVELSKRYGAEESSSFINGVLGAIYQNL